MDSESLVSFCCSSVLTSLPHPPTARSHRLPSPRRMNLTQIGNYLVHYKTINSHEKPPAAGSVTARVAIPSMMLHVGVHQPTGQRCLVQVLERKDPKDSSALAREVKAQLVAQGLPDTTAILRLREVLQDQDQPPPAQQPGATGGRGLKRKLTGDAVVDQSRLAAAGANTQTAAPVHRYYLMFEGFRDGEACDMLDFAKLFGRVPENVSKTLFAQLLETVSSLHDLGIIHGDLKLPNVLVVRDAATGALKVKVKDFRYSTITSSSGRPGHEDSAHGTAVRPPPGTVVTEKGELLVTTHKGSPAYLAPEVTYLNQPFDGKKADTYSLGVILYTMLYGAYPITATSLTDLFDLIRKGAVSHPSVGLSKEAVDLVTRLMDKDPATRLTLKEALRHPWLYSPVSDEEQIVPFAACAVAAAEEVKKRKKLETMTAAQGSDHGKDANATSV